LKKDVYITVQDNERHIEMRFSSVVLSSSSTHTPTGLESTSPPPLIPHCSSLARALPTTLALGALGDEQILFGDKHCSDDSVTRVARKIKRRLPVSIEEIQVCVCIQEVQSQL
jgi:hypothetical protein